MKKEITVVAAIIEEQNEILCALRSTAMSHSNMWEFPGGKVEKNEDFQTAVTREIYEELHCEIEPIALFHDNTHEYDSTVIRLITYTAKIVRGTPTPKEHAALIWLKRENLDSLKWAPADLPAVRELMTES